MNTDLEGEFAALERLDATDLREEIGVRTRSSVSRPIPGPTPARRVAAAVVAIAVFASAAVLGVRAIRHGEPAPAADPWAWAGDGWTELPTPPEERSGAVWVWDGKEILAWGGCAPGGGDTCRPTADGFAFDPETSSWTAMPAAPFPGYAADYSKRAVWTGTEVLFWDLGIGEDAAVAMLAFDPATELWRRFPGPPVDGSVGAFVWTGRELLVWGGARRSDDSAEPGAAFDPQTGRWRALPPAPIALNRADAVWTGNEAIVFGSLLDSGNHAATPTAVGAAFDPSTETWRKLPPSTLSPQAVSAVWLDGVMIAWDYGLRSQAYDPGLDTWSKPIRVPLDESECYNSSAVVGDLVFGFYCGDAALYDARLRDWKAIAGGPLDEQIYSDAYKRSIDIWRFGDLVPASDVLVMPMEGITLMHNGEACYGCPGSPLSYWVYRSPVTS
jgi:hypothetical protein